MSILIRVTTFAVLLTIFSSSTRGAVTSSGDTAIGSTIQVGNSSFGTYRVDAGSTATASSMIIGSQTSAVGFATVTGAGSQLTLSSSSALDVGGLGIGRLDVLSGGVVLLTGSSGQLRIGVNTSSQGTVVVDGSGSLLQIGGQLIFGTSTSGSNFGSGSLQVSNGGIVNVTSTTGTTIQGFGRLALSGGLFRTNQLNNNGLISGDGEFLIQTTSDVTNSGRIEAGAGDLLRFTGTPNGMQNSGTIAADGGEIQFNRTITNSAAGGVSGEITLRNGTMRILSSPFSTALSNSALLAATGGENDFYGRITNHSGGTIGITNHSVLIFHDDVIANGGTLTVFPGSTGIFLEDLTVNSGASLHADLAGTAQDSGFGEIEVVGTAQLAGSFAATLATGYTPHVGDVYPLLAAGAISGSLALGAMPELPSGLKWDLDVVDDRLLLSVVPGLAGDYNSNGVVDAADYVVWRKTLDQIGNNLAADGDSNGRVDAADYDFWRSRIGNSAAGGALLAAAVPEPGAALAFIAVLGLGMCRGRNV